MATTIKGVIFRRTIRASYCSLDLILSTDEDIKPIHVVALIQFHHVHDEQTSYRSYLRRQCKLGSEVLLTGSWNENDGKTRFEVYLSHPEEDNTGQVKSDNIPRVVLLSAYKLDMVGCQRLRDKHYPAFQSSIKNKVKQNIHNKNDDANPSLNTRKKSSLIGQIGHGGGLGKRLQGDIVADFLILLVSQKLEGTNPDELNDRFVDIPFNVPDTVRDRYISFQDITLSPYEIKSAIEYLNGGSGVIDAAGGSGHVSLAFSLKGVKSTVIDPRDTVGKLPEKDRKLLRKRLRHSAANESCLLPPPIQYSSMRAWFGKIPNGVDIEFRERNASVRDTGTLPICTMCSSDGLLPNCRAIIALHPDEATDEVCDFAISNQIPFVVTPCCVFSRLFPNRRKKINGELVATYEDLIEYLVNKHPSIRITKLDFDGANLALWSIFDTS